MPAATAAISSSVVWTQHNVGRTERLGNWRDKIGVRAPTVNDSLLFRASKGKDKQAPGQAIPELAQPFRPCLCSPRNWIFWRVECAARDQGGLTATGMFFFFSSSKAAERHTTDQIIRDRPGPNRPQLPPNCCCSSCFCYLSPHARHTRACGPAPTSLDDVRPNND